MLAAAVRVRARGPSALCRALCTQPIKPALTLKSAGVKRSLLVRKPADVAYAVAALRADLNNEPEPYPNAPRVLGMDTETKVVWGPTPTSPIPFSLLQLSSPRVVALFHLAQWGPPDTWHGKEFPRELLELLLDRQVLKVRGAVVMRVFCERRWAWCLWV